MCEPKIIRVTDSIVEFDAVLQEGSHENRNKRIYPSALLQEGFQAPFIQERLKTRSFYGEAGHPLSSDIQRQLTIDHGNISHLVTNYRQEGDLFMGRIETAATQIGKDMRGLIVENKSLVAFSMRGMAPVRRESGKTIVSNPFKLFCYDWVQNPSHDKAFMAGGPQGLNESVSEGGIILPDQGLMEFTQADLKTFLVSSSANLREGADMLEIELRDATLTLVEGQSNVVDVKGGGIVARLFLEESVQRSLDDYMLKTF
jgi:hypothetical protein